LKSLFPHHQPITPSPSSPRPPWQNHPQSPASNSAVRSVVSYQATSKPHAAGTHVAIRSAGWPASNGTVVANPRRRRGAEVASSRCVGWHSSNPWLCWPPLGTAVQRPHIRSCRRRSRRPRRGSVAVQERSDNCESHDLRGARLQLKTNPRPSNRRLLRIPSHCLLQAQSRAEDKSRRSEDHTVRSLDLLTPDRVEWTRKHGVDLVKRQTRKWSEQRLDNINTLDSISVFLCTVKQLRQNHRTGYDLPRRDRGKPSSNARCRVLQIVDPSVCIEQILRYHFS
jgi:hypothetical protein